MDYALGYKTIKNSAISEDARASNSRWCATLYALPLILAAGQSHAANPQFSTLANLSIEELGNIQVTSVSKKEESLAKAAASIYVITADAIHRSGARSLPEALRLAPNLLVAQIDANKYAISARGFNSNTANKLLVMIDGRTVYTPLYSGVFWDAQGVMLQDVDRIEVISGSGGTLWGANAVNGVISIITKSSTATNGNLIQTTAGNTERGLSMRHGGDLNDSNGSYRVYATFHQWQHSVRENGAAEPDAWDRSQAGFRTDWHAGPSDFTVQGDAYRNSIDQLAPGQQSNTGANLLARWNKQMEDGANLRVQTYVDHSTRDTPGTYNERLNTLDLDVQYSLPETEGKHWIWGGGYRISDDHVGNSDALAFLPAHRTLRWGNLFVQQERDLWSNLQLTLGAKVESNVYTGAEFLPNLKLAWKAAEDKLLWVGLSRSVRAPSRIDTEFYLYGKPPYILVSSPDFRSEIADTVELGWRAQAGQSLSYSVVAFHSEYDYLRSVNLFPSRTYVLGNDIEGKVNGLEALANFQVTRSWSLEASTLLLDEHFSGANLAQSSQGNDPHSQWTLSSKWNISTNQQLDISLRHVGKLPSPAVPDYMLFNIHYGWDISHNLELGITGRNLLDPYHQEFASSSGIRGLNPIQVERALDMALVVRF